MSGSSGELLNGKLLGLPCKPVVKGKRYVKTLKTWNGYVNFTREPIIETIISPKEGYKLLVRSSKGASGSEEYFVDAVEVVSFGNGYFFRSLERPKPFLVPVSDYEVLEVKETRVALKSVSHDRSIKIGGGREASIRQTSQREPIHDKEREDESKVTEEYPESIPMQEGVLESAISSRMEKRRDRRRRRHRRDDQEWNERRAHERERQEQVQQPENEPKVQGGGVEDETKVSSPIFSSLIPPPTTLISETLSRYKDKESTEEAHKEVEQKGKEKKEVKKHPPEEDISGSQSSPLNRIAPVGVTEILEGSSFTSTHFSGLPINSDPYFF